MLKLFHYFLLTDRDKPCRNIFLAEPVIIYDFAVVHTLFTKFSISLWVSVWRYTIYFWFIVFIANFSTNVLGNNSWNQKSNMFFKALKLLWMFSRRFSVQHFVQSMFGFSSDNKKHREAFGYENKFGKARDAFLGTCYIINYLSLATKFLQ